MKCKYCQKEIDDQAEHNQRCTALRAACEPGFGNGKPGAKRDYTNHRDPEVRCRKKRAQRQTYKANAARRKRAQPGHHWLMRKQAPLYTPLRERRAIAHSSQSPPR